MKWLVIRIPEGIEVAEARYFKSDKNQVAVTRASGKIELIFETQVIASFENQEKALEAKLKGEEVEREYRGFYQSAYHHMCSIKMVMDDKRDDAIRGFQNANVDRLSTKR